MNVGGWARERLDGRAGVNISFPEHNSATLKNVLMVFGRIIDQVSAKCHMQE